MNCNETATVNAVSTTSIPQAHAQAKAKVLAMRLYHLRFLIQCGGIRIMHILIGGTVIPLYLVWPMVIRGPKGRTVPALDLVCCTASGSFSSTTRYRATLRADLVLP